MQNSISVKKIFSSLKHSNWFKPVGLYFSIREDHFLFSAQIDYVIDAIDEVDQKMLDDERVRIAAGIFHD